MSNKSTKIKGYKSFNRNLIINAWYEIKHQSSGDKYIVYLFDSRGATHNIPCENEVECIETIESFGFVRVGVPYTEDLELFTERNYPKIESELIKYDLKGILGLGSLISLKDVLESSLKHYNNPNEKESEFIKAKMIEIIDLLNK